MHENREISRTSWSPDQDRSAKAINRTADVNVQEKSECAVVPVNQPNKEGQPSAEAGEGRAQTEVNIVPSHMRPTQRGKRMSQGWHGVRQAARERKQERFTALLGVLEAFWIGAVRDKRALYVVLADHAQPLRPYWTGHALHRLQQALGARHVNITVTHEIGEAGVGGPRFPESPADTKRGGPPASPLQRPSADAELLREFLLAVELGDKTLCGFLWFFHRIPRVNEKHLACFFFWSVHPAETVVLGKTQRQRGVVLSAAGI